MTLLRLLGPPQLETPSQTITPDRRMAGMLAYLALEGSTHKYKLAGWLWPDSEETTARNNMRQMLRRIRLNIGPILSGDDLIELSPEVEVDIKQLSYLETPSLELLKQDVELLAGLEYDDTYDFADWLTEAREELRALRWRSAKGEAERLERLGNHRQAIEFAQVWWQLEPLSEEAARAVIRLHYLLGDRGAALAAFNRLEQLLHKELGTAPLPETAQLAQLIERGGEVAGAKPKPKETLLPTTILRPPILAGREREWALMEEAWAAGKTIFLSAEGGVGKTRLASDYLASKGAFVLLESRPGDTPIPYASNTRYLRTLLARYPDFQLQEWARQTLAAWMPELGAGLSPESLAGLGSQNRLLEATQTIFRQVGQHGEGMLVDDLHYQDDPSMQLGAYLLSSSFPLGQSGNLRAYVACFRKDELSPAIAEGVHQLVEAGLAVWIELEPLPSQAVRTLLEGLGLPESEHLVPGLARYTGGNPLFILETLKHLIETDSLGQGLPSRLAPPGKVATLIGRRLGRLSAAALNLARAAAVASSQFNLNLAAGVLERPSLEVAEAHAELEHAQILRGNAFTHDLVYEAVLTGIPAAVRQVLHQRTAEYLAKNDLNPALIAQHWLEASQPAQAAPWLFKAADLAHTQGVFAEAIRLYQQTRETSTDDRLRLQAQVGLTYPLVGLGRFEEAEALIEEVLQQTSDPHIRVKALDALQGIRVWQGRYLEAEAVINEALTLTEGLGDTELGEDLQFSRGFVVGRMGRYREALEVLEPLLPRFRLRPPSFKRFYMATNLGFVYVALGYPAEGMALHLEALNGAKSIGSALLQVISANQIQVAHNQAGTPELAFAQSEEALKLGEFSRSQMLRSTLTNGYFLAGRPQDALSHIEWLIQNGQDPGLVGMAWARLAQVQAMLGQEHQTALAEAVGRFESTPMPSAHLEIAGAALEHGDPAQQAWARQVLENFDLETLLPTDRAECERLRKLASKI